MPISKILYPTKLRELSFTSLLEFLSLKKCGLEEIILLHVIPREEVSFVPFGGFLKDKALELKESAVLKFKDWAKELIKKDFKVKFYVEVGETISKIFEIAEKEGVDLIIIGKKKTFFPWEEELSGKIIEKSKIPILLYRRLVIKEINGEIIQRENVQIFRKPLFAHDFSEAAQRALLFLLNFKELIEELTCVHVITKGSIKELTEEEVTHLEEEKLKLLKERVKDFEKLGIPIETFLRLGDPMEEIIKLAYEKGNTFIVIGKSSKGLIQKYLLGSVAKGLIQKSEFPLLIVP